MVTACTAFFVMVQHGWQRVTGALNIFVCLEYFCIFFLGFSITICFVCKYGCGTTEISLFSAIRPTHNDTSGDPFKKSHDSLVYTWEALLALFCNSGWLSTFNADSWRQTGDWGATRAPLIYEYSSSYPPFILRAAATSGFHQRGINKVYLIIHATWPQRWQLHILSCPSLCCQLSNKCGKKYSMSIGQKCPSSVSFKMSCRGDWISKPL